jgi:hypothetical protein
MVDGSTIDPRISFIDGGHLHRRSPNFHHRWWTAPPSIPEFPPSMVDGSTIDPGISIIDGGHLHHRSPNFHHRWWTAPPSIPKFPPSMVGGSTIDRPISCLDGGRLYHRSPNFLHRWWTPPPLIPEFPASIVDTQPSIPKFPESMVDASSTDAGIRRTPSCRKRDGGGATDAAARGGPHGRGSASLISVTRPCSTTTCTPEPIANPCSSSHRPDIRRYGTTASGRGNPELQKHPSHFYDRMTNLYLESMAMAVRRICDDDRRTLSLVTFLRLVREDPSLISRAAYGSLFAADTVTHPGLPIEVKAMLRERIINSGYDQTVGAGVEQPNEKDISKEITALLKLADTICTFADKRLAHFNRQGPKELPTLADINAVIEHSTKVIQKYLILLKTVSTDMDVHMQYDWLAPFRVTWLPEDEWFRLLKERHTAANPVDES